MNPVKKEAIKGIMVGFFVMISFFLGYIFAVEQNNFSLTQERNTKKYIEIQTRKDEIKIVSVDEGIDIIVNGKISTGSTIGLK